MMAKFMTKHNDGGVVTAALVDPVSGGGEQALPNVRLREVLRKQIRTLKMILHVSQDHLLVLYDLHKPIRTDAVGPVDMPQRRGSVPCMQVIV